MISRSEDVMNFLLDDVLLASVGSNLMATLVVAARAAVYRVVAVGRLVIDRIVSLIVLYRISRSGTEEGSSHAGPPIALKSRPVTAGACGGVDVAGVLARNEQARL